MKLDWLPIVFAALCLCNTASAQAPVYFPDANLKAIVEDTLWISDPTPTDMLGLVYLIGSNRNVESLYGLESATSLVDLTMSYNQISDISMLSGLNNLTILALSNNQISDISPLSGLGNLVHLDVHDNDITDVAPLAGLNKLETLFIRYNDISDISALAGLTTVRHLDIHGNHSSDISALAHLTSLEQLHLQFNQISDISPLSGLVNLHTLNLRRNQISDISPLSGLKKLELLDLDWNYSLNDEAYCTHLHTIYHNNPHIDLSYSPQRRPPTDMYVSYGSYIDQIEITWKEVCNGPLYTSYYRVFRAPTVDGVRLPLGPWQTARRFYDVTAEARQLYHYWVRMSINENGRDPSEFCGPGLGKLSSQPSLTISSTAGGEVTVPGEGIHVYPVGVAPVEIRATPADAYLFSFAGWTGSAAEAGLVSDVTDNHTTTSVNENYHLRANFVSVRTELYVDDNAVGDPGPGDSDLSDPWENGTEARPFDRIQEAIEVAAEDTTIIVRPGTYHENIDSLGKCIQLIGLDPSGTDYPVIQGGDTGPAVSFRDNHDPHCQMAGFQVTHGRAGPASAIYCRNSSPTFSHCLIAGNSSTEEHGDFVLCIESTALFTHCTIADNYGSMRLINSNVTVTNSIIWGNNPGEIHSDETSELGIFYTTSAAAWPGEGNIASDPLFGAAGHWLAAPGSPGVGGDPEAVWVHGDYHPMSQTGRWDSKNHLWIQDPRSSPCIDGGDPTNPVGLESAPHGGIANMGAYGGTVQAGKSL